MKTFRIKKLILILLIGVAIFPSCTDLTEEILDEVSGESVVTNSENIPSLVTPAYGMLRTLWHKDNVWGLAQITTDETMVPVRGGDWWDGGAYLEYHTHTWTSSHVRIKETWDALSKGLARANYSLQILADLEKVEESDHYNAELRYLRAHYIYYIMDLFGQVPFREFSETDYSKLSKVFTRVEAFEYIVTELNDIMGSLGDKGTLPYGRITKDAAKALLAKLYLNKEVYTGQADWKNTIKYCDDLINSGRYAIADDYFDIFAVDNDKNTSNSDEGILVVPIDDAVNMGVNDKTWVQFTLHYNHTLDGNYSPWNGACTTADFVNTWDMTNDLRFQDDSYKEITGTNLGFIMGQQYKLDGTALLTRQHEPLSYTIESPMTGASEEHGVRVLKYAPKVPIALNNVLANDFVIFRISDFYLMRAEAKFRDGQDGLSDLNAVRVKRGLSPLTTLTEQSILDERGFELYWEGHRRQDLIRFGKFGDAWTNKEVSSKDKELFPIPVSALDVNSNLTQNPGY